MRIESKGALVVSAMMAACGVTFASDLNAELSEMVKEDLGHVIRPGQGSNYWWNVREEAFMYPPAFGFQDERSDAYRFTLIDDRHARHVFFAKTPQESLLSVWPDVPVGMCTLVVDAVDARTNSLGVVGTRTFWKRAAFRPGTYPSAVRPYREAALMAYEYVLKAPHTQYLLRTGKTDPSYVNNSYPTKMLSSTINAMIHYAKLRPENAEESLKVARVAADYLLANVEKPGTPLAGCPPTYETRPELKIQAAKSYEGQMMMVYPANAGQSFLRLAEATGEAKYRHAALVIADLYLRLQGEDGTWPLMLYMKDGKPNSSHRLFPLVVTEFLEEVAAATGDARYTAAMERAFAYVEKGPFRTFNWNGQYEDAGVQEKAYWNLTKDVAVEYAEHLLRHFPDDPQKIESARELLRFAEDLFVYWERPCREDGTCIPQYPKHFNGALHFRYWYVLPGVGEQHGWNVPIDASAAKMINAYLAFYRVTRNPLDLAKAKTLGDSVTRAQFDTGDIPTHWTIRHRLRQSQNHGGWINCLIATAQALENLAAMED